MEVLPGVRIAPRVIDTAVGKVEFDLTGKDGPVVLASHGGLGGVDQARLMLAWLDPSQYRLLSVSRPGYLGTPLASGPGIAEQAELFAALLNALGIATAAVVTLSAGGPPGYVFAARYPDRVSALVAISSVSGQHQPPEAAGPIAQSLFMSRWGQKLTTSIMHKKPRWFLQQLFQSTAHLTKDQVRANVDTTLNSTEALTFILALMAITAPYSARKVGNDNDTALLHQLTRIPLGQVRCPALILHGTHDADVPFSDGVYAYEHIPRAQRVWIEQGSHLAFWLSPHAAEAQATAREFLRRHSATSSTPSSHADHSDQGTSGQ